MLVFTLLNPWRIAEHFNTLPLLPDSQVPHEVSSDWIQPKAPASANHTAPEGSLIIMRMSSCNVNPSSHVSNELPMKLAI